MYHCASRSGRRGIIFMFIGFISRGRIKYMSKALHSISLRLSECPCADAQDGEGRPVRVNLSRRSDSEPYGYVFDASLPNPEWVPILDGQMLVIAHIPRRIHSPGRSPAAVGGA